MSKRLSLILGAEEHEQLAPYLRAGTGEHRVLQRWAVVHGVGPVSSEAGALRALLRAGAQAVRDESLDAGYAELAEIFHQAPEGDERRTARERYLGRTEAAG